MSERLRVNPIACEAHGMCAELLPERRRLDEWGYPIVDDRPLPPALVDTPGGRRRRAPRSRCCSSATADAERGRHRELPGHGPAGPSCTLGPVLPDRLRALGARFRRRALAWLRGLLP